MVNKDNGQMPLGEFPSIPLGDDDDILRRLESMQRGQGLDPRQTKSTKAGNLSDWKADARDWWNRVLERVTNPDVGTDTNKKEAISPSSAVQGAVNPGVGAGVDEEMERLQKIEKLKQEVSKGLQTEANASLAKLKVERERRDLGLQTPSGDPWEQFIKAGRDAEMQSLYKSPEELLRQLGENEAKQSDSSFIRNAPEGTSEALAIDNVSIREHLMRLGMTPDEITNRSTTYSSTKAMELSSRDSNILEKLFGINGRYNKTEVEVQLKRMMVNSGAAENLTRILSNRAQRMTAAGGMSGEDQKRLDNINAGMIQAAEIAGSAFSGTNIGYRLWNGADESGNLVGGGFNVAASFYEAMDALKVGATSEAEYLREASQLQKQYTQEMESFVSKISEAVDREITAADIKQMREQIQEKFKAATAFGLTGTGQRANAISGNLNDVETQMIIGRKKMYDRAIRFINDLQATVATVNFRRETRRREEQKKLDELQKIRERQIRESLKVYPKKVSGAQLWPL